MPDSLAMGSWVALQEMLMQRSLQTPAVVTHNCSDTLPLKQFCQGHSCEENQDSYSLTRSLAKWSLIRMQAWLPKQSVCTSASRRGKVKTLQSIRLNWIGVGINFQITLQCQSKTALLVQSHSPLLGTMGKWLQSLHIYKLCFPPGARSHPRVSSHKCFFTCLQVKAVGELLYPHNLWFGLDILFSFFRFPPWDSKYLPLPSTTKCSLNVHSQNDFLPPKCQWDYLIWFHLYWLPKSNKMPLHVSMQMTSCSPVITKTWNILGCGKGQAMVSMCLCLVGDGKESPYRKDLASQSRRELSSSSKRKRVCISTAEQRSIFHANIKWILHVSAEGNLQVNTTELFCESHCTHTKVLILT